MIRLTWRLARPNILSSVALLAAVALFVILTRRSISGYLDHSGLNGCLVTGGDCESLIDRFNTKFDTVINASALVNLVPILTGIFWGAPLMAREIEQGTHRLAWTQSASRGRWFATKLGIFLLGAAAVAAVVSELMTWWFAPIQHLRQGTADNFSRLAPDVFDFRGIVPVAYTLFAFALGVAAGAIVKRTVAAIVTTLVIYIPVKAVVREVRGRYQEPQHLTYPLGTDSPRAGRGDWIMDHVTIDGSGNIVNRINVPEVCRTMPDGQLKACMGQHGYRFVDTIQPIERFWTFQFIESGIFVGLGIVLLAVATWWVIRRAS